MSKPPLVYMIENSHGQRYRATGIEMDNIVTAGFGVFVDRKSKNGSTIIDEGTQQEIEKRWPTHKRK